MVARPKLIGSVFAGAVILGPFGVGAEDQVKPVRSELAEPVFASLQKALGIYEQLREELAADRMDPVPAHSLRLVGALRLALKDPVGLDEDVRHLIGETADAAEAR